MTEKFRKKRKVAIWITCIALGVVAVLMVASKYAGHKFKPLIKEQIKALVLSTTDSLYHIEFSSLKINMLTANASLNDVRVVPDTQVYRRLIERKKAPNNIYYIELQKMRIRNFHLFRFLKTRKLNINELILDQPKVTMVNRQFAYNENKSAQPKESPYNLISAYLKEFRIRTINFNDVSFKYINHNHVLPDADSVSNLNVTLKDYLIDSTSAQDKSRLYLLKDIVLKLKEYTFATPDSLYHVSLDQLDFSASSGKLNINSFNVIPRYDEMKFGTMPGAKNNRYHIRMSNISLDGIDLTAYILKQQLLAREMNVANGFIDVFSNAELSRRTEDRTGRFPQQLLQRAAKQISIDKINLNNVGIGYSVYHAESKQKGTITFENTFGTITNVTNAEKFKNRNPLMVANLTSYVMGRGKLDVNFKFDLKAKDGAFSYSGALHEMDGKALNRITRPLGMLEIRSGAVEKLNFNVVANDREAKGRLWFKYKDLSVSLLKKEDGESRLVKQGWMSFLANAMVLNASNPDETGKFVTADLQLERAPTMSFFSFVWKTLLQGIRHSVGVTVEKEQQIKTQIARFKEIKASREERQRRRERRRAAKERIK